MGAQAQLTQPSAMALATQDLLAVSTTAKLPLGTTIRLADGRGFVYGQAGGTALAPGKLAMTQATDANEQDEDIIGAVAAGATIIPVTFGGAVTANQFAGGFIQINDDTGEGNIYTIASHPAGTASVPVTINEPIRTATIEASTASIIQHPCAALVISAATAGSPVGVPLVSITADNYGWFQTKGVASVLGAGTLVIGQIANQAAGGAVAPNAGDILPACGTVLQVSATTEYSFINLDIPGF